MIDHRIRRVIDPTLDRVGLFLARKNVSANALTIVGFLFGLGCMAALAFGHYPAAAGFFALNRIFDGLDGSVARQLKVTDSGAYLDIVLDFIFYSGFVFAFQLGRPEFASEAAFLIFGFVGTGSSFLAYSIFAAKRNLPEKQHKKKSIVYLGGLAEGFETILCFLLMLIFPDHFPVFAWTFGALCWITAATRIYVSCSEL